MWKALESLGKNLRNTENASCTIFDWFILWKWLLSFSFHFKQIPHFIKGIILPGLFYATVLIVIPHTTHKKNMIIIIGLLILKVILVNINRNIPDVPFHDIGFIISPKWKSKNNMIPEFFSKHSFIYKESASAVKKDPLQIRVKKKPTTTKS